MENKEHKINKERQNSRQFSGAIKKQPIMMTGCFFMASTVSFG